MTTVKNTTVSGDLNFRFRILLKSAEMNHKLSKILTVFLKFPICKLNFHKNLMLYGTDVVHINRWQTASNKLPGECPLTKTGYSPRCGRCHGLSCQRRFSLRHSQHTDSRWWQLDDNACFHGNHEGS